MGTAVGILFFMAVGCFVFMDKWPKWVRANLSLSRSFLLENCYVGDEVQMTWKIENKGKLPISWLRLDTNLSSNMRFEQIDSSGYEWLEYRAIHSLPAESALKYEYVCAFNKRGYYLFKDVDYSFTDYLGLHTHNGRFSDHVVLYVYPKLRAIDALVDRSQQYMGEKEVRRWIVEDPLIHMGSRDYTGSEPMKYIHWNATAQTGKLQVKKFAYTTELSNLIILNAQTKNHFWEGTEDCLLEQMVETVASYVSQFEKGSDQYGFASNCPVQDGAGGVMLPITRGRKHYHKVFRALTQITHYTNCNIAELVRYAAKHNTVNTHMIVVTGIMSDALLEAIRYGIGKGFTYEIITLREVVETWSVNEPNLLWYSLKEGAYEA